MGPAAVVDIPTAGQHPAGQIGRREVGAEADVAVGVGGDGRGTEIILALPVAGRVGCRVGVEVQGEGGVGRAVEGAGDDARGAGGGCGGQHRVVLLVVPQRNGDWAAAEAGRGERTRVDREAWRGGEGDREGVLSVGAGG